MIQLAAVLSPARLRGLEDLPAAGTCAAQHGRACGGCAHVVCEPLASGQVRTQQWATRALVCRCLSNLSFGMVAAG